MRPISRVPVLWLVIFRLKRKTMMVDEEKKTSHEFIGLFFRKAMN